MDHTEQSSVGNHLVRQSLISVERVIGTVGLNAVLRKARLEKFVDNLPPNDSNLGITIRDYARLNQAIEDFFGRASAAILTYIGEAIFDQIIRDELITQRLGRWRFDTPPHPQQLTRILEEFAGIASQLNPAWRVDLQEKIDRYVWVMYACPVCQGRVSATPICHVYIGILRGAVRLAGTNLRIEETQCVAMGAPVCQFEIFKIARQAIVPSARIEIPIAQPAAE